MELILLQSCPFCDSDDLAVSRIHRDEPCSVVCSGCGAEGPYAMDDDEARALWNARPEAKRVALAVLARIRRVTGNLEVLNEPCLSA